MAARLLVSAISHSLYIQERNFALSELLALDGEVEASIQSTLEHMMVDKTVLATAYRLLRAWTVFW
jgi:ABC-type transport system involved in Fe-S cluster assembly fused permease/ATPase subunit